MVRNYKPKPGHRQNKKYDPQIIERAIKEIKSGKGSISKIATKYEITKSVLHRSFHKKINHRDAGHSRRILTLERQEHILKYINACVPWEYYLTSWDIRLLMKFYLDKRSVITKRKLLNNLPGKDFVASFLKTNADAISHRIIQNLNNDGKITVEVLLSYFHELKSSIAEMLPDNIVCFKDIPFTDRMEKNEGDESKASDIFLMMAGSATGELLPPYVMYKEQNCYEILRRSMSKQRYPRLSAYIFEDWFKSVILPYYEGRPGKKCLIGCFFSSRISLDLLEICKEHQIDCVFMPHNSSNLTHPLDTLSQLIQTQWNNLLLQGKLSKDLSQNIEESFQKLLQEFTNSATEKILDGFKKTGISPINPLEVLKQLPDYNETTIEDVDEEFKDLENMQNFSMDLVPVKDEMEWSDECNNDDYDNDYDEEIESKNNKITPYKSKDKGKKSKYNETYKTEWKETGSQMNVIAFDLKLSPIDFQDDLTNEDNAVDHTPEHNLNTNASTVISSCDLQFTGKTKEPNEIVTMARITKCKGKASANLGGEMLLLVNSENNETGDIRNVTEEDPLLNLKNSSNLHKIFTASHSTAEPTSRLTQCENAACDTHTRLLEAILSSVTRQEKLQERTVQAMEAQERALGNIARLLEERGMANNTNA